MIDLDVPPRITRPWWAAGHVVLVPYVRGALRLRVSGRENIPAEGPVLVVSNHISELDPPMLGVAALPRKTYYMAKQELFSVPAPRPHRSSGSGPSPWSGAAPTGGPCAWPGRCWTAATCC